MPTETNGTLASSSATMYSADRVVTTHVGSLPRSAAVVQALAARASASPSKDGTLDPDQESAFDTVIRAAVREVVERQRSCGIDVVSDGEQSKVSYATYVGQRLSGFSGSSPPLRAADLDEFPGVARRQAVRRDTAIRLSRPCCTGPIAVRDEAPLKADLDRFAEALRAQSVAPDSGFIPAASPGVIAVFQANRHYATQDAYLAALADAMRSEYRAIVEAGFLLQIDCPDLAMGRHLVYKDASDDEFVAHAERQLDVLEAALDRLPPDRLRLHVCWGNYDGPHHRDIALERLFGLLMRSRPRALLFEASNPRHAHEWQVFAERRGEIPDDKVLVPGVVSSTTNYIEHPELVAERIVRFAGIVGRERVIAGTDCGFSTFAGDGVVDPDVCWAKLEALAQGARIATRKLWRHDG